MEQAQQIVLPRLDMDDVSAMIGESEVKIRMRDKALERLHAENQDLKTQLADVTNQLVAAREGMSSTDELQRVRTLTEQLRAQEEQRATLEALLDEQKSVISRLRQPEEKGVTDEASVSGISDNAPSRKLREGRRSG